MVNKIVVVSALLLSSGSLARAQGTLEPISMDAVELFERIQERPTRIHNARFDFVQGVLIRGQMLGTGGRGTIGKSDKMHLVTYMDTPMGQLSSSIISDGQIMWHEIDMPGGMEVIKYDLATLDAGMEARLSGFGIWASLDGEKIRELKEKVELQFDVQIKGIDKSGTTPVYVVGLTPRSGPTSGPVPGGRMEVRLGVEDIFLRSKSTYDQAGNILSYLSIDEPEFNVAVGDSHFTYAPPQGVVVKDGNAQLQQMSGERARKKGILHQQAPDFALEDLEGEEVDLKSLRGKTLLLNFWATWCGPCIRELPHVQRIHDEFNESDLVVLGINSESGEKAQRFMHKYGYTFKSLKDEGGKVMALYQIQGIPTSVIIDPEGIVQHYMVGYRPEKEVRAALAQTGVSAQ